MKISKSDYLMFFQTLVKSLVDGDISLEEFYKTLHILCSKYRKEYPNVIKASFK